jgi:hypothetical protein
MRRALPYLWSIILDRQFPFLYIQPIPKQLLITFLYTKDSGTQDPVQTRASSGVIKGIPGDGVDGGRSMGYQE